MKCIAILSLFLSSSAFAANFPTGTFTCRTSYKTSTVLITAVQIGGLEFPAVVVTGTGTFSTTGIGATSKGIYGNTAATITLTTGLHNTVFNFDAANKLIAMSGNDCL